MKTAGPPSLAARALLALALLIGFHLLACGIAAALLSLIYFDWTRSGHLHLTVLLACGIGAAAILWSVVPRFAAFVPPGPRLHAAQEPRLFEELAAVARAANQPPPLEVYLVPDVNAWVSQRGGVPGWGGQRVLSLGFPLLPLLTCAQLRAVLAHEFGHYHGGDARLGPLVHQTRDALGRTLQTLGRRGNQPSLLQLPFRWYARLFLHLTQAVSRRQELVADAQAARWMGAGALAEGLRIVHAAGPAFEFYWQDAFRPVLAAGFRPPLLEGFLQYLASSAVSEAMRRQVETELKGDQVDPHDTHPPLRERLEALARLPPGLISKPDPLALSLVQDVSRLERALVAHLSGPEAAERLTDVTWAEVGAKVYQPQWTALVRVNARALDGLTTETLPAWATDPATVAPEFVTIAGHATPKSHAHLLAAAVVGAALALRLVERGHEPRVLPGHPVTFRNSTSLIQPFEVLGDLQSGRLPPGAWQERCAAFRIQGLRLAGVLGPSR